MRRSVLFVAFFLLLCAAAGQSERSASAQSGAPAATVPPGTCEDGAQSTGAIYRICMPTTWNGSLVVYAHGYVAPTRPIEIPEEHVSLPGGGSVSDFVTALGYAFVMSSYSTTGFAIDPAIDDLIDAVGVFVARQGQPQRVLLTGVSDGALIAALSAERYPNVYDGALVLCGTYGDLKQQVNYIGDSRVLFDYFFPGLIPPTAVQIPPSLLETWETETYSTTVKPQILDPTNADKVSELLATGNIAFDSADPATKEQSISLLLWYNIYGTNDAKIKLGGQPFDNQSRAYSGSSDDATLNMTVARFSADPEAQEAIDSNYRTSGRLAMPVVAVHTLGDPLVPVAQLDIFAAKVAAAGAGAYFDQFRPVRYGHCNFTPFELLGSFNQLVDKVETLNRHKVFLPNAAKP